MFRRLFRRRPERQPLVNGPHLDARIRRDLNLPPRTPGDRWSPPDWWMR